MDSSAGAPVSVRFGEQVMIMIASAGSKRATRAVPGELSMTR